MSDLISREAVLAEIEAEREKWPGRDVVVRTSMNLLRSSIAALPAVTPEAPKPASDVAARLAEVERASQQPPADVAAAIEYAKTVTENLEARGAEAHAMLARCVADTLTSVAEERDFARADAQCNLQRHDQLLADSRDHYHHMALLRDEINDATARAEAAERDRDGWIETARQHARNEDYYQGIVDKILEPFGVAAYTSDDGSVQDSPLRAKAVELVNTLRAELADMTKDRDEWKNKWRDAAHTGDCDAQELAAARARLADIYKLLDPDDHSFLAIPKNTYAKLVADSEALAQLGPVEHERTDDRNHWYKDTSPYTGVIGMARGYSTRAIRRVLNPAQADAAGEVKP